MHIGEVNTLRLWPRLEVMLCRGELLGIPLMTRCAAICYTERVWLRLRLFLSVDGRYRRFEGCLLGCLTAWWGWVRKHAIPVDEGGGLAWGKPPSLNIPCISPFESGYPLIPFLWLCKDTKKILNIQKKGDFDRWSPPMSIPILLGF
jgi:hypothetical protein